MSTKQRLMTLMLMVLAFGLWGCTKCNPSTVVTCDLASKYSDQVAGYVAPILGCTGVAAMSADITAELQKQNICSATPKAGPIATMVCPPIISFIVGYGAGKLPVAWACTGGAAATWTAATLTAQCEKIPY